MDEQLEWVTNIFSRSGIHYWADSGTLLGLVRDNKIIEGDNDLDLSIWAEDVPEVIKLLPEIKRKGYRVRMLYFAGDVFKFKIISNNKKSRVIDITIYRKSVTNFAWSPQPVDKIINSILLKVIRRILLYIWNFKVKKVFVDKFPWKNIINIYTWWIPAKYFENIVFLGDCKINIPHNYVDYLIFRYGDWQTPNPDWNFMRDDNGLKPDAPGLLL